MGQVKKQLMAETMDDMGEPAEGIRLTPDEERLEAEQEYEASKLPTSIMVAELLKRGITIKL